MNRHEDVGMEKKMDRDFDNTNNTNDFTSNDTYTSTQNDAIEQEFYQSASGETQAGQFGERVESEYTQKASTSGSYSANYNAEPAWQPGTFYQEPKKTKKKKEKKPVTMGSVVAVGMAFMVATVAINTAVTLVALKENIGGYVSESTYNKSNSILSTQSNINEKLESASGVTNTGSSASGELTISDIADAMLPSVVSITSTTIYQSNNPFMFGGTYQTQGAGSGIIIGTNDEELLIVTNNHVVEDTTSLTIEFVDGETVEGYVKGTKSSNDLAVVGVKLDDITDETSNQIRIATLGDSDELEVGDQVVAIGNALGYGQSLTVGYVSALNRTLTVDDTDINAIQTDASINGGNSGGALINMKGEVVGINFAKQSSSGSSSSASVEGMGYAIPISEAKEIINELMNMEVREEVDEDKKGYIGITNAISIDSSTSEMYGIPRGAYLKGFAENSPAEKAGIQIGDVVVAVDGQEIDSYDELQEIMGYYEAGETVTLTIKRVSGNKYEEQQVEVTLCTYDELLKLIEE